MTPSIDYWAGFFDGEGCVMLSRSNARPKSHYSLRVKVAQVDPRPLRLLQEQFGGTIRSVPSHGRSMTLYQWTITTRLAERFLAALVTSPYLLVKREQVEFALWGVRSNQGTVGKRLSWWQSVERDSFAAALSDIKHISHEAAA